MDTVFACNAIDQLVVGDSMGSLSFNLTTVLAVLGQLSDEQLEMFYNVTNTHSRQELIHFLNTTSVMSVKGYERGFMQFSEFRIQKMLLLYVSPILILLGTLGNMFSFIILRRKPMLKVSSYIYLAFLAIIDTVVLYIGLGRVWIKELTGFDYQASGNWICKLSVVFGYVASDLSVWLIIAVTVERYIVVCFPFKASSMCNVSRAKKVVAFLSFLMLALNFHFFWTVEIVTNGQHDVCQASMTFRRLVEEIWPWVDTIVYSFSPFVTIMILNVLIIREVSGARSNRMLLSGSDHDNSVAAVNYSGAYHRRNNASEGARLTPLLLTVSFTFLLLTLPNNISLIITRFWNQQYEDDSSLSKESRTAVYHRMAQFTLAKAITELLMYTNHSINFFLYCATGNKFRQQIFNLFRCAHRSSNGRGLLTTNTNTQSMRRTSQSCLGTPGASDLVLANRSNRRRSSGLSSDLTVGGAERNDDSGIMLDGKTVIGDRKESGNLRLLQKSNSGSFKNGSRMLGCGRFRNSAWSLRTQKNISNSSMCDRKRNKKSRSCKERIGFPRNSVGYEQQEERSDKSEKNGMKLRINNGISSNPAGCQVYYSSKDQRRLSPSSASRSNFSSVDTSSPKDNEYVVLQPTLQWWDDSTRS